ncbi:MAG: alpha-amylase family glycosyl hydrolase [Prolixibacteraceae bacterium]
MRNIEKIHILIIIVLSGLLTSCHQRIESSSDTGLKISEEEDRGATDFVFGNNELTDLIVQKRIKNLSGIFHNYRINPRTPKPGEEVAVTITVGPNVNAARAWCYYTTDGSDPEGLNGVAVNGNAVPFLQTNVIWDDLVWGYITEFRAVIPAQSKKMIIRYLIECGGEYARGTEGSEGSSEDRPYFAYAVDDWQTPDWIYDAVMYYVLPDRFYPGDNSKWIQTEDLSKHMGGTLKGVRQKLDYLQELGINTLWLMPFMKGPEYHKYGASDFYAIDPRLGTEQDLKDLIRDVHSRGMKVLVDFVANHCSKDHPYFKEALADSESKYRSWFEISQDGTYESFFNTGDLPHLVNENPEVRKYLLALAVHWVKDYGIDGFDLDYAIGPSHEFWTTFSYALRQVSDTIVLFTEGVTTPEALLSYAGRTDGCQDFAFCQAARKTFAYDKMNVQEFERFLHGSEGYFPEGFIAPVMIDNQNMDRFLFVSGNDKQRLKIASACLFSMSRPVSLWAGTEMGMTQKISAAGSTLDASRNATSWENMDTELLSWFKLLAKARKEHLSLARGKRKPLIADAATGILAYEKVTGNDRVVVALNNSDSLQDICLKEAVGCRDILGGNKVSTIKNETMLRLPARSAAYLVPYK